jgi:hypothetical protein
VPFKALFRLYISDPIASGSLLSAGGNRAERGAFAGYEHTRFRFALQYKAAADPDGAGCRGGVAGGRAAETVPGASGG